MAQQKSDRPLLTGGEQLGEPIVLTRGGRPPKPPRTFQEARKKLVPQVDLAIRQAKQMPTALRGRRIIVEATVLPNYLANSHHPSALLAETGLAPIGSRGARGTHVQPTRVDEDAPAKTYLLSGEPSSLPRLQRLLQQSATGLRKGLTDDIIKIESINLPQRDDVLRMGTGEVQTLDGLIVLEAVLHPIINADNEIDQVDQRRVFTKFRQLVESHQGAVRLDRRRTEDHLTFVPVLLPAGALTDVAAFNPLRTLRPMPRLSTIPLVITNTPFRSAAQAIVQAPGTPVRSRQRIAIFDGGADVSAPALAPYTTVTDLTGGAPEDPDAVAHGTAVASAALYGNLTSTRPADAPPASVDVFRVWPPPASEQADTNLYWVLQRIEEQVTAGAHRIINLSLGPQLNVEDDHEPHAWTLALDRMSAELGVTFVVAAGNTGEEDADAGLNRIGVPADTINGISVGACDAPEGHPVRRASYSSVGPGRAGGRVAPVGVIHGGTEDSDTPFGVVAPGGLLARTFGTSISTPYVSRSLAELGNLIGPGRVNPHTLRAFATHFAERVPGNEHEVGWGRLPSEYEPFLGCAANEATVLYEGKLRRGQSVKLPIPLPEDLLRTMGHRSVGMRYSLVFTTPIDGTDPVDYGRSGIEVVFRPHDQTFTMNKGNEPPKIANRDKDPAKFNGLVVDGWRPSDRPRSRSKGHQFAPETERREDGKWETTARADDSLAAASLLDPAFDLHFLARDSGALTPAAAELSLPYTLLVSITAPADIPLYQAVRNHSPVLSPLFTDALVIVEA